MILADTSVWISHFRQREPQLWAALGQHAVLMHPYIIGELACGTLSNRSVVLRWLEQLPRAPIVSHTEVLDLIERRRLIGRGIGYVDAHLLASILLTGTDRLFTNDKRLAAVATELNVGYVA